MTLPAVMCCVFTLCSGEKIQTSKSVILSDQRESRDLRTIDTAWILRLRATALRMTKTEYSAFLHWVSANRKYILCGRVKTLPCIRNLTSPAAFPLAGKGYGKSHG